MNSFQIALDRYLTSEPEDDMTPWFDKCVNSLGDMPETPEEEKWMQYLYNKGYSPEDAALLIRKTYYSRKTK